MRRLFGRVVALLLCCPTQLLADPLGNLGQLFPFVGFLFCIPCAVLIWSLAYRGRGGQIIASGAYQRRRVPAPAIAVLGIMIMIGLSGALIWALFPTTCRQMFGL